MIAASPGVTLTEAAQAKFNHDTRQDDQVVTPVPGSSGIPAPLYSAAGTGADEAQGWTLQQVAAAKFDRDGNGQGTLPNRAADDERQPRLRAGPRLLAARQGGRPRAPRRRPE